MEDSSKDPADSLQNNPIVFMDIAIESEKGNT